MGQSEKNTARQEDQVRQRILDVMRFVARAVVQRIAKTRQPSDQRDMTITSDSELVLSDDE
jgi:hypothetical protein